MRLRLLFGSILLWLSLVLPASNGLSQQTPTPSSQPKDLIVEEIINQLNVSSFPFARIGLDSNVTILDNGEPRSDYEGYSEWAVFKPGFKMVRLDKCMVILKNEDVNLSQFGTQYPNPKNGSISDFRKSLSKDDHFTGLFYLPLDHINPKKIKGPFQTTKKPEEARGIGWWRIQFKLGGKTSARNIFFLPTEDRRIVESYSLAMKIFPQGNENKAEFFHADTLHFTFDDKDSSLKFVELFLQAVNLCKPK